MTDEYDSDRAAILARRQGLILMALAGLSGCPSPTHVEQPVEPTTDPDPFCSGYLDILADSPDAEEYYREANQAARGECPAAALRLLRNAYALMPDPKQAGLAYFIGMMAYEAGDHQTAREALTFAVDHWRSVSPWRHRHARRLLQDLENGRTWEQTRPAPWHPTPRACLSKRGIDG